MIGVMPVGLLDGDVHLSTYKRVPLLLLLLLQQLQLAQPEPLILPTGLGLPHLALAPHTHIGLAVAEERHGPLTMGDEVVALVVTQGGAHVEVGFALHPELLSGGQVRGDAVVEAEGVTVVALRGGGGGEGGRPWPGQPWIGCAVVCVCASVLPAWYIHVVANGQMDSLVELHGYIDRWMDGRMDGKIKINDR